MDQPRANSTVSIAAGLFLLARVGLLLMGDVVPAIADVAAAERAYKAGDYATAFQEFLPLAKQGSAYAQSYVAYMYDVGNGVPKNSVGAVRWYRTAATQGEVNAQFNLGLTFEQGDGVRKDYHEAAKWYQLAANQEHSKAEYRLGLLYRLGNGVPKDYAECLKLLRASARQGLLAAQADLGFWLDGMFEVMALTPESKWNVADSRNQRLIRNSKEAASWYRLAAEQGAAGSQRDLGLMYLEGRGVPQSDTEAVRWLRTAADQGDGDAQLSLSRIYKDGRGVPQDYVQAHMWANLAVSDTVNLKYSYLLGPEDLARMRRYYTALRDELAALMTPGQLAEAQTLARNWKPSKASSEPGSKPTPKPTGEEVLAGTGFLVGRFGQVITNHHVVDSCTQIDVFSSAGRQAVGIVADDVRNDLAVVGPIKQRADSLALSGQRARLGESVMVVGYPLQGILASSVNITTGTVSPLAGLHDDTRMLQITAPVQPGNSGGPLLDQTGAVMGVVSSKLDVLKTVELVGDVPQNVNFAIREAAVQAFLDANGIEYATQPPNPNLDNVTIAERARKAVVRIECRK